ncbi:MAG: glycosyltransferase [Acidimicrobiales bacterium]
MTATRTKRILSVQPVAERGGSDRALARTVRSLTAAGWECHIALPEPSPMAEEFIAGGATLHVVPMRRITTSGSLQYWLGYLVAWPLAVTRLTRLVRRLDASVVHSNSLHPWYGWAAADLTGRPHVWHAREIVVQSRAALALERWLCAHFAATVVAVSRAVADQLRPGNVVVVYDQVDGAEFRPGRAGAFRARIGLPDEAVVVGSAGRIDTWKGLDVLLDAVPELQRHRPDLEVAIAGAPVAGKEAFAERLSARARAMPGVHWVGARSDVADLIADLDVLVMASTEPEPFGLAAVEALASGVPVVATAAGGPLEILGPEPAGSGRLVAPGDAAALASAVLSLLPAGASSTEHRRARPVLATATPRGDLAAVLEAVSRRPKQRLDWRHLDWRRRRGTEPGAHRRSGSR